MGLGRLAFRLKRWGEAEERLRRALVPDGPAVDANRALGDLLARRGRLAEAIRAYERSLTLALRGGKVLRAPIRTRDPGEAPVRDPDHFRVHACLARLYARIGEGARAIDAYRVGIAGGYDGPALRCRLACLLWQQRRRREAVVQGWTALRMVPSLVRWVGRDLLSRQGRLVGRR